MQRKVVLRNIWILSVLVLIACSTEKNAFLNRSFHNVQAHYNGYWNANEIIRETNTNFETGFVENYEEILPVFIYPNKEEATTFKSPMDTAIKKCEIVINKHQMPLKKVGKNRNEEWCSWIDDNWFTIGQAQFFKRDYEKSMEKFVYIEKNYKTEPIIFEAMLWQAKILIEQENYLDAQSMLDELVSKKEEQEEAAEKAKADAKKKKKSSSKKKNKKKSSSSKEKEPAKFPEKLFVEIWPVYADLYLRKGDYDKAKEALETSIDLVKDRQFKTRLIFILAQLNHEKGLPEASELYAEVVKRNPKYDMAFNAKINKAISYSGSDKNGVKTELRKMLKDEKNVDYYDQIYYTVGNMELADGNIQQGIQDLEASVRTSTSNTDQKSKSFLKLGKIYYQQKSYVKAQKYYDSTLTVLKTDHPEYETISSQNISLTELVDNLSLAEKQDSLVMLCGLSDADLEKKIAKLIEAEEERILAEEQKKAEQALKRLDIKGYKTGDYWAFNAKIRDKGFDEFKEVWGTVPNDDNWRRSDKTASFSEESETEQEEKVNPKLTIDYYKKDLPCKEDQIKKAEEDILNGYYGAANVYKNQLDDDEAAFRTFAKLDRFLPKEKAVESLYQQFILGEKLDYTDESNTAKNKILNDYPNSKYAKLIKNPNYLAEQNAAMADEESEYVKAYTWYKEGNYGKAVSFINERTKLQNNPLSCKYFYLKALAEGKNAQGSEDYSKVEAALEELVKGCGDADMIESARATLDLIRNTQSKNDALNGKSKYIYEPEEEHFFVIIFPNDAGSVNKAKTKVSNLNVSAFSNSGLSIKSTFLDANNQMISVRKFSNKTKAIDYYTTFKFNKKEVVSLQQMQYFAISSKNFSTLFVDKGVDDYMKFFNENYLD